MAGSVGLVGREGELSRLLSAVGGDGQLLLVVGDARVGKTRFVTEGMGRLAGGAIAVWGGCLPMRESLPLLPLADALGELSRMDRGGVLESALTAAPGYVRGEVAAVAAGARVGSGRVGGFCGWAAGSTVRSDRRPFDAVARRRRIVLVVEDVHWADAASLDCLTFLTRPAATRRAGGGDLPVG